MTQDLIYSRNTSNAPLSLVDIMERAPAALWNVKGEQRGENYAHIQTRQAIDILADHGYQVTQAAQVKSRRHSDALYARHLLALSNPDLEGEEGTPEIILYNSGDGKSALRMYAGFYRFICSNGLVAGSGFEVKARHSKATASNFEGMIKRTAENFPWMLAQIRQMKATTITANRELALAEDAVKLRWDKFSRDHLDDEGNFKHGIYSTPMTVRGLINPTRAEDQPRNLWTSFNKIQEGLIRGGVKTLSVTKRNPGGTTRKSRPMGNVKASLDVNRQLWDLVANQVAA